MSNNEQLNQPDEPLSCARNYTGFLMPDATQGIILRTPPCEEIMREKELVLARIDGYAIIPMEAYHALNLFEQLRAFYKQIGDG